MLGDVFEKPIKHYTNLEANPYGINDFYMGALKLIDKYGKSRYLMYDTKNIEIINPHSEKYKFVPQGTV